MRTICLGYETLVRWSCSVTSNGIFFILQSKLSSVSLLVPFHNQRITKWTSKINRFCSALEANYQMNFKYTIIIINFKQILKGNQRYFTISQPSQMNVDSLTQIQDMLQNWNLVKSRMRIKMRLQYYRYMDGFDGHIVENLQVLLNDHGSTSWNYLVLMNNSCPIPIGFFAFSWRKPHKSR